MIVDVAVYERGKRLDRVLTPAEALACSQAGPGRFTWVGMSHPSETELDEVASLYALHPLAVEDALHAHQRPKVERYDGSLFVVLKTLRYVDHDEVFDFGEVMLFVGPDYVVTVRHGEDCGLPAIRRELEADPARLEIGPAEVLHTIADRVVDLYEVAASSIEEDIDEIQAQVFGGPTARHAERIFRLKREVLQFRQAVFPLAAPMDHIANHEMPVVPAERRPYFMNVHDHVRRVGDRVETIDALLDSALHANVAQVGMRQNEDMRKISAWVAIISVPTMFAGIYGMNFDHMPELRWRFGYPLVLAVIAAACFTLYRNFKRRDWL
ncbi:MAG: magnesium and cobalt transport protein CorA [Acidimicrobiia bacterium]